MKTTIIHHIVEHSPIRETKKDRFTRTLVKFLFFLMIIAFSSLLTSCLAVPQGRHPQKPFVIIEQQDGGGHHDNGKHNGRK